MLLETPAGRLRGLRIQNVRQFRGIPYARAPEGPFRWRWPEEAASWAGERDATRFGAVAPQSPTAFDIFLGGALSAQSEDCLHLNVFSPEPASSKFPVMVWVHGGAFVLGAGSQSLYDGRHLAAKGAVVVTINYRLGALGFLALSAVGESELRGKGATGLADQIAALEWVRRNIAVFGGDSDNITLFGESAGAMCVAALLASPCATGLFHKAIMQSGGAHIGQPREQAARVAHAFLSASSLTSRECHLAAALSVPAILRAQSAVLAMAHRGNDRHRLGRLPFQPVIDGDLLPERPIDALRGSVARDKPLMVGTTREEWKLFSAPDPRLRLMTSAGLESRIAAIAGDAAATLIAAYGTGSAFERYNAFMTDRIFAVPAQRLIEARLGGAPVYAYRLDWRAPYLGGIFGACHAIDLGFVFGTHGEGASSTFFGRGAAANALANDMMDCWVAFAGSGDPSSRATPSWTCYEKDVRSRMIFGAGPPHIANAPDRDRLEAWRSIPDQLVGL